MHHRGTEIGLGPTEWFSFFDPSIPFRRQIDKIMYIY